MGEVPEELLGMTPAGHINFAGFSSETGFSRSRLAQEKLQKPGSPWAKRTVLFLAKFRSEGWLPCVCVCTEAGVTSAGAVILASG